MRSSIGDDADLDALRDQLRTRHKRARRLELAVDTLHVVLEVVGTFAVLRLLVVSAAAREVGGGRVLRTRKGAIGYAVAIHIFVPGEAAQTIEILLAQRLPA